MKLLQQMLVLRLTTGLFDYRLGIKENGYFYFVIQTVQESKLTPAPGRATSR